MPEPPESPVEGLVRKASPGGTLLARQALGKLQARLFGRRHTPVKVGRYVLEDRIGSGGAGLVYRAFDPKHDRKIAIKLLHAEPGPGYEAARARLLREAQSLASLSHPNVVRVYDVGTYDTAVLDPSAPTDRAPSPEQYDGVYIAMELLEGADLERWLEQGDRDWRLVLDAFVAAGRGLAAAHERGLCHRDFKPANVWVGTEQQIRVLDFGLARPLHKDVSDPSMQLTAGAKQRLEKLARPLAATLTTPGTLLGTPAYMAPEQHERKPATARSDQYSFCLALYEAWYGRGPFLAQSEAELKALKLRGAVAPPPEDSPVPPHLFDVLRRGLSPRPDDRFASMDEVLDALNEPPPRSRRQRVRRVAAAGVIAALGLGAWMWSAQAPPCELLAFDLTEEARLVLLDLHDADDPDAGFAAARSLTHLDATEMRGTQARLTACASEPRDSALDRCLTEHQRRFDALVARASAAKATDLLPLDEALARWPRPDDCSERSADPIDAAQADALLLYAQGRLDEALQRAQQALDQTNAQTDPAQRASATGLVGHLLLALDRPTLAEPLLGEVLWSGAGDGHHPAVVHAAVDLLTLARERSAGSPDAALWIQQARQLARASEIPSGLRQRLYLSLGLLDAARGDTQRAGEQFELGLAIPDDLRGPQWHLPLSRARDELPSQ